MRITAKNILRSETNAKSEIAEIMEVSKGFVSKLQANPSLL